MKNKNVQVTKEKLSKRDYYRVQMHLRDPLTWAICYGILRDFDSYRASSLRDKYALEMEVCIYREFQSLWKQKAFVQFAVDWISRNVDDDLKEEVREFMRGNVRCPLS